MFVNGTMASSIFIGWPISADATDTNIGGGQSTDIVKEFFAGSLDEVRLYNGQPLTIGSASLSAVVFRALGKASTDLRRGLFLFPTL